MNLEAKIKQSYQAFDQLPPDKQYILAFSGGKDSHVLLGVYLGWMKSRRTQLDIKVVFSDTQLEVKKLYTLIDNAQQACKTHGIPFIKTEPDPDQTFWVIQFGRGYPVPTYRNRWCTDMLKVRPMKKFKAIAITGVHKGESTKRDKRLNCNNGECGISDINGLAPIVNWRNCDVWDYITTQLDDVLYQGACDNIMSLYEISESQTGSLRMGCFMCPVVGCSSIEENVKKGISTGLAIKVRALLEELRGCRRIPSPHKIAKDDNRVPGAIYLEDRKAMWAKFQPILPDLLAEGYITQTIIDRVENLLELGTYPKTYKPDWIAQCVANLV